ncbi:MAG: hypothetical protein ABSE91_01810 [Patescibacteria group bacterium]|jgi:hypothetical protein
MNYPSQPANKPPIIRPWMLILLVVVIVGAAIYWWFEIRNAKSGTTTASTSPTPAAVVSTSATPTSLLANSPSSSSKTTPTASSTPVKTWTGKLVNTVASTLTAPCIPNISFNYPADYSLSAVWGTSEYNGEVEVRIQKGQDLILVDAGSPRPNNICDNSLQELLVTIDSRTIQFGTINGYSTATYTSILNGQSVEEIMNNTDHSDVAITDGAGQTAATNAAINTIVNSLKFK